MRKIEKKRCGRCQEIRPVDEFYKDQKSATGLSSYCKKCKSISRKEHYIDNKITGYQWDLNNPQRAKNRKKKYRDGRRNDDDKSS